MFKLNHILFFSLLVLLTIAIRSEWEPIMRMAVGCNAVAVLVNSFVTIVHCKKEYSNGDS
ncbi:MAG TPA: hypothetical protein DDY98_07615 [Ruminococcaceae bacterium]|nr:hypothetical protein [Oscillospiraceae bacterium]